MATPLCSLKIKVFRLFKSSGLGIFALSTFQINHHEKKIQYPVDITCTTGLLYGNACPGK
jgi:hypothetical protein